jgi:hypothetical protein
VGRHPVPPRGDEHVNHLPELINCSVYVPPLPGDLHVGLIHEPAISYSVPAGAGSLSQQRREPLHPPVHSDMVDLHTTLSQQFLDIAVRQAEAQVPANSHDDHVGREAEAGEGRPHSGSRARAAGLIAAVSLLGRGRR